MHLLCYRKLLYGSAPSGQKNNRSNISVKLVILNELCSLQEQRYSSKKYECKLKGERFWIRTYHNAEESESTLKPLQSCFLKMADLAKGNVQRLYFVDEF